MIDDVALSPLDRRYNNGSATIVTTNRGLAEWGGLFGDAVVASAIIDRLLHNAIVFSIKGPSWRLRQHQALIDRTTKGASTVT